MDETGIVRRLDDMGRLVVPAELRRTMRWRNGDPILMAVHTKDSVLLSRYREVQPLRSFAAEYSTAFYGVYRTPVAICDEAVYLTNRGFRFTGSPHISRFVRELLAQCTDPQQVMASAIPLFDGEDIAACGMAPIVARERAVGAVLVGQAAPPFQRSAVLDAASLLARMIASQIQY